MGLQLLLAAALLIGMGFQTSVAEAEGQLRRFEKSLEKPASTPHPKASPEKEGVSSESKNDSQQRSKQPGEPDTEREETAEDLTSELILKPVFEAIFYTASSPFWIPHDLLKDDLSYHPDFQLYPFHSETGLFAETENGKTWTGHASVGRLSLSDHLSAWQGSLAMEGRCRFGLEGEFTRFRERISDRDELLSLAHGFLTYAFAQTSQIRFQGGIGFLNTQGVNNRYGVHGLYRISGFFQPIVTELNVGLTVGGHLHPLWEVKPKVGVMWRRYEWGLGFLWMGVKKETITGPETYLRVWF